MPWWSIHSCPAFILYSLHSRQPRKVSLRGASLGNQKVLPPYIWTCRIVYVLYTFMQTFLFTKEHIPLSCCTCDSQSIVNLTRMDTSHSWQPRNGCFVPRFGEQTHISSGSSHESLWSCSKWVALIRREPKSSYLHVPDKNCWTCNSHATRSSSEQVSAWSNAQWRRHRCCIFTAHARKSPAVHWIFRRIVSVPISS